MRHLLINDGFIPKTSLPGKMDNAGAAAQILTVLDITPAPKGLNPSAKRAT